MAFYLSPEFTGIMGYKHPENKIVTDKLDDFYDLLKERSELKTTRINDIFTRRRETDKFIGKRKFDLDISIDNSENW